MAKRVGGIARTLVLQMIPGAIKAGFSASGFLEYLKAHGLGYRRTIFLADWRSVLGISQIEGLLRFVRRDRLPSIQTIADVEWQLSKEYMFKAKIWSQTHPDKPMTERFVNIMSDILITPSELIRQVSEKWQVWSKRTEKCLGEPSMPILIDIQPWAVYRRKLEIQPEQ